MTATLENTENVSESTPVFGIVVGEHSGDTLGAGLISALKAHYPKAEFVGIGGPKMKALGFDSLYDMEELSVMGIFEVLGRLRRLFKVRDQLVDYFSTKRPDVFIGIDAPDFNLRLELPLKQRGIKTVHYVSPSVWAWRPKRIFNIAKATDMVLSLLPFEKAFYDNYQVPCTFVGHPLADDIPMLSDKKLAREKLQLADSKTLAIMPGSRGGELTRLAPIFLEAAKTLHQQDADLSFIAPMISDKRAKQFTQICQDIAPTLPVKIVVGDTQTVMAASDCLLTASGTVTLEAALIKRPMIICYKFNAFTYHMFKGFVKVKWFSLPNLLANKTLLPELLQSQVTVENLLPLLTERLYQPQDDLTKAFTDIHHSLRRDASKQAALAVVDLCESKT
ncbi:lipid-A-disaccharide synthase [Thalassotalea sp. 1_MG-2023]|uniref:lipid-A-disaccharide synthase n=1 Tax=Thalassotalea sp. 1_MG-2023 TaxID=3062680 RepID=UPI0026E229F4|nr:lipid-A-disaccharide synthase [Thalassotalea sp. 1_MG-2023]MDO6426742.1 lipid-A-disaccharide synthase [Thalassotalea sp. 1_MG-2023]